MVLHMFSIIHTSSSIGSFLHVHVLNFPLDLSCLHHVVKYPYSLYIILMIIR